MKTKKNKTSSIKRKQKIVLFKKIIYLFFILFTISIYILFNDPTEKSITQEKICISNYMDCIFNGTKFDNDKMYFPSKNPKISIIISVYNGEAYLKTALLSIQNQDFKDIEIIMVDDGSEDNSVNLIKQLMETEPRIILLENKENKGVLFTKSRGILNAKGKYIMTMDEDDIYVQKDAFSILYYEAEKNNLDILGFVFTHSGKKFLTQRYNYRKDKRRIIYQPELSNIMYYFNSNEQIEQFQGYLVSHFIKSKLFKKIINLIDKKNLEQKMNYHDDFILFFLLTRNAYNIKYINRLFYIVLTDWDKTEPKIKFRTQMKEANIINKRCFAFLNFLDILFKNTKNTILDKKIAFSQLDKWYLQQNCTTNINIKNRALEIFKLFLANEYVTKEDKNKIIDFINNY